MTNISDDDFNKAIRQHKARLDEREALLEDREAKLLDRITMQAIAVVLLRSLRRNGKLKPADLNEIRFARENWQNDDYNPSLQIQKILAEGFLDREERRPTPPKR